MQSHDVPHETGDNIFSKCYWDYALDCNFSTSVQLSSSTFMVWRHQRMKKKNEITFLKHRSDLLAHSPASFPNTVQQARRTQLCTLELNWSDTGSNWQICFHLVLNEWGKQICYINLQTEGHLMRRKHNTEIKPHPFPRQRSSRQQAFCFTFTALNSSSSSAVLIKTR